MTPRRPNKQKTKSVSAKPTIKLAAIPSELIPEVRALFASTHSRNEEDLVRPESFVRGIGVVEQRFEYLGDRARQRNQEHAWRMMTGTEMRSKMAWHCAHVAGDNHELMSFRSANDLGVIHGQGNVRFIPNATDFERESAPHVRSLERRP
jgi:hypothetical protein